MGGILGRRPQRADSLADCLADRLANRRAADRRLALFPALVTTGSLGLALVLFFQSTVPALKERQELLQVERHHLELQRQLIREATGFALRRTALSRDIQTLLLELDRQGVYPAEFLAELRSGATTFAASAGRQ